MYFTNVILLYTLIGPIQMQKYELMSENKFIDVLFF